MLLGARHRIMKMTAALLWRPIIGLLVCQTLPGCQLPPRTMGEFSYPTSISGAVNEAGNLPSADSAQNRRWMTTAVSLMHAGKFEAAREQLVEILTANPSDTAAVELLADVSQKMGDYRLQRASLARLIALQPRSAMVANRAGKSLLASVQTESTRFCSAIEEPSSASPSAARNQIRTDDLSAEEASTLAIAALSRAVDLEPRNTLFAQDLFATLIGFNKDEDAERVLQDALRRNPQDRILPMAAARLYESREDWSSAVFYYDVALRNDPANPVWRRQRAVCHFRQGSFEKARADFSRSLAGSPVKPQLSEHLAWAEAALKTKDNDEAQRVLDLIVTEGKLRTADIEVLRGTCLLEQGNVQAAADIVLKAQQDWPRHEGLWRLARQIKAAEKDTPGSEANGALDLASLTLGPAFR